MTLVFLTEYGGDGSAQLVNVSCKKQELDTQLIKDSLQSHTM